MYLAVPFLLALTYFARRGTARPAPSVLALHSSLFRFTRNVLFSRFQLCANAKNRGRILAEFRNDQHVCRIDLLGTSLFFSIFSAQSPLSVFLALFPSSYSSTSFTTIRVHRTTRVSGASRATSSRRGNVHVYARGLDRRILRANRPCVVGPRNPRQRYTHVGKLLIDRVVFPWRGYFQVHFAHRAPAG